MARANWRGASPMTPPVHVVPREDPEEDDGYVEPDLPAITRSVMTIALGYHNRLPKLEELQREDRETAREGLRLARENAGVLVLMREDRSQDRELIVSVAEAVKARPADRRARRVSLPDVLDDEPTDVFIERALKKRDDAKTLSLVEDIKRLRWSVAKTIVTISCVAVFGLFVWSLVAQAVRLHPHAVDIVSH